MLEPSAVCPWCGYIHNDSWELDDEAEEICGNCDKEFKSQREVEVTYSTVKTDKDYNEID